MSIDEEHDLVEPEPEKPGDPGKRWKLIFACLVGVFMSLAAYDLISGGAGLYGGAAASRTLSAAATHSRAAASSAAPHRKKSPSSAVGPAQHPLRVTTITAFGPNGTADGDNPGIVSRIVDGSAQPWYSSWYASAKFGDLQSGTGLLLDMGKLVTISSVRLTLGQQVGAAVQVRVGATAALADLSTAAAATDVSGTVRLRTAVRVSGRYVLIWFTALPPIGQGKYQVSVYGVTVDGITGT